MAFAFGYFVKLLLHVGGEVIVNDGLEEADEEFVYEYAYVGRYEFGFLEADVLFAGLLGDIVLFQGEDLVRACLACDVFLLYIFSFLYCRDGRGVSGIASRCFLPLPAPTASGQRRGHGSLQRCASLGTAVPASRPDSQTHRCAVSYPVPQERAQQERP